MIRLVVFDAYGTLFDVYSISSLAESLFPGQGQALSVLWRDKQIEYSRLISLSDPMNPMGSRHYQSFWDLTRLGLQYACQRLELELTPAKQKLLMDQYAQLTPFPENLRRSLCRPHLSPFLRLRPGWPEVAKRTHHPRPHRLRGAGNR